MYSEAVQSIETPVIIYVLAVHFGNENESKEKLHNARKLAMEGYREAL